MTFIKFCFNTLTEEQQSERETQGLSQQVSLVQDNSAYQLARFTPSTSKNGIYR